MLRIQAREEGRIDVVVMHEMIQDLSMRRDRMQLYLLLQ